MSGFLKSERLCHFHLRHMLFAARQDFFCYPFRIAYLAFFPGREENILVPSAPLHDKIAGKTPPVNAGTFATFPAQCLITVSSKRFRKATQRNSIKRLVREAYRKNKSGFYAFLSDREMFCLVAFIYSAGEILPFSEIESKMTVSLHTLMKKLHAQHGANIQK